MERGARSLDLGHADAVGAIEDLALQVGEVDLVAIGEDDASNAACGEVKRRRAAEAARAHDEGGRAPQPLLPLDPDLGEQDMPAVAEKLLVLQFVFVLRDRGRDRLDRLTLQMRDGLLQLEVFLRPELDRLHLRGGNAGLRLDARRGRRRAVLLLFRLAVGEVPGEVGLAHARERVGRVLDHDVRLDAQGLDRAAARRVVARRGELDGRVVAERHDGLHRALAERLRAHDLRALVVLQRAGDDLGGGRRAAVHEDDHRNALHRLRQRLQHVVAAATARVILGSGVELLLRVFGAPVGRHDKASSPAGKPTRWRRRRATGRPGRCAGRAPAP